MQEVKDTTSEAFPDNISEEIAWAIAQSGVSVEDLFEPEHIAHKVY